MNFPESTRQSTASTIDPYTTQLMETRNQISRAQEQLVYNAKGIDSNSSKFVSTHSTYENYNSTLHKSNLYMATLRKQHVRNLIIVYGSFFFLVITVALIIIRRLFYPNFYRDSTSYFLTFLKNNLLGPSSEPSEYST